MDPAHPALSLMQERFGRDSLIALATLDGQTPSVRTVNAYYENGSFYVITHRLSRKMEQIRRHPHVAVSGDWFTGHATAVDLGWLGKAENREIAGRLRQAFASWIDNGHNDFSDPNTIVLRIKLTDGVLFSHGTRYDIDFSSVGERLASPNALRHPCATPEIRTKRLWLRRFVAEDADDYYAWAGCPEASRFIRERPAASLDQARAELRDWISRYPQEGFYLWGIVLKGELVGFCCGNEINEDIRSVCLGYGLQKRYWNQGIATEAAQAMIDFFFQIGFHRIFSYHHPLNPASGRVMEKSGMTYEGRIRGGSTLAGEICDCLQYSIVKEDWESRQPDKPLTEKQRPMGL